MKAALKQARQRFGVPRQLVGTFKTVPKTVQLLLAFTLMFTAGTSSAADSAKPTDAQLAEAHRILRETPIIDGHNDVPWEYRKHADDINAIDLSKDTSKLNPPLVTDIPRMRAGEMGGQFWSVYIPATMSGSIAVHAVLEQIDVVHQMMARWPATFELARTANDIERIQRSGKIASLIGMEGGHSIDDSLAILRMTYQLGARYMTLTHTKNVSWADSANDEPKNHGLSKFGEDVVHEMNRLGMMVDLAHVSPETMRAAIKVSRAPVIFSHSCCRALCDNPRNVPDDILKQMPANGGIVMITFFPEFLTERANKYLTAKKNERERLQKLYPDSTNQMELALKTWMAANPEPAPTTLKDVADHIDYARKIAGIDYVGVGGDYEGFSGPPEGLEDVSCYPALMAELLHRGYNAEEIKKVAGKNLLRVFRQVEEVAAKIRQEAEKP